MFVLIIGGGRNGTELAHLLLEQNHKIRVIEHRTDVLSVLHHELPTEVIYQGDPTDVDVLEQAGIREAQVIAACLPDDADNLVVCYLGREIFKIPRTVARINNPRNAWLFNEKFHVDASVNHSQVMAGMIEEEVSMGDMVTLLKLKGGEYSIVEEVITPGARAIGILLKDLALPENCVIAAILRKGKVIIPRGSSVFEDNDEVLAVTDRHGAELLSDLFSAPE
jgi:trk system potassium uptake protein TrkA